MLNKLFFTLFLLTISLNLFAENNPQIRIVTNQGDIELQLDRVKAPLTVGNFLQYAKDGFYSGTVFHRVIKGFMIQGGGFTQGLERKTTRAQIQNEAFNGLKNDRGTIAMARTNLPHSASSQFFINAAQNDFLNHTSKSPTGWGYTVFGKVTKGLDIVSKIEKMQTGPAGIFRSDVPVNEVVIQKVEIISE